MLLKITHTTDLNYTGLINETVMALRMAPRQETDQHRLSFTLAIGPATPVTSHFDWLGNMVHTFSINPFHEQIQIVATSVVETHRPAADPRELPDIWPIEAGLDYTAWDYLQFSPLVTDSAPLRSLVNELRPVQGEKLGGLVVRMLQLLDRRFTYEKGITTATSPIDEILQHGRGVCQDFTHLMIGLSRALRVPARYVSGYLHPDRGRYRGYTQTHAWCELFFPSYGWVGVDATNNCIVTENFVRAAVGRDYRDVPPNKGFYRGNVKESMQVTVHSEEMRSVPPGLPAERFEPLRIGTHTGQSESWVSKANLMVVQQQQSKQQAEYQQQQQQQ